jgi:LCP family protein required for cell wall assembly
VNQAAASRPDPRAPLAAFFSFVLPGLGQAYNRQPRLAVLLGLPVALLVIFGVLAVGRGSELVIKLLDVRILWAFVLLNLAVLAWRAVAIYQAHATREAPAVRSWTTWATGALLAVTLAMHLLPTWYATSTLETLAAVGQGGGGAGGLFVVDPKDVGPAAPEPSRTPPPAPWEAPPPPVRGLPERFSVLLLGVDLGPGRSTYNTDTMIVATIDPRAGTSLVSIPRDTFGTPLGDGRVYNAKLNSLFAYARIDGRTYPLGGPETIKAAVGALLGIKIDYVGAVDFLGFTRAIDAVGGVDVTVTRAVHDWGYMDEYNRVVGFHIEPGTYHMDGYTALAFARSRKGAGDSDYTRAERQQLVIAAMVQKMRSGTWLLNLPILLGAIGDSVASDIPVELMPHIAEALIDADLSDLERLVIQPPLVRPGILTDGTYILTPDIPSIQAAVQAMVTEQTAPVLPTD